jgi:hypothetical protein
MKEQRNFYEEYRQLFTEERLPAIQRLPLRSLGQEERPSFQKNARPKEDFQDHRQNNTHLSKPWKLLEDPAVAQKRQFRFAGNFKQRDFHDMYTLLRSDVSERPEQSSKGKRRNIILHDGLRAAGVALKKQGEDIFVPKHRGASSYKDKLTETHIKFLFRQQEEQEASRQELSVGHRKPKGRRELTDLDIKLNRSVEPAGARGPVQTRDTLNVHKSLNQRPLNRLMSGREVSGEISGIAVGDNNPSSEAAAAKPSQETASQSIDRLALQFRSALSERGPTIGSLCAGLQAVRREIDSGELHSPVSVQRLAQHPDFLEALRPLYKGEAGARASAFATHRRLAAHLSRPVRQKELKKILLL